MNSKTKNREGVSDLNIDSNDPTSRLTDYVMEKADDLKHFLSSVFTVQPDGDNPHIPTVELRHRKIAY